MWLPGSNHLRFLIKLTMKHHDHYGLCSRPSHHDSVQLSLWEMAPVLTAHEEKQYVAITSPLGFMVCPSLYLELIFGPFSGTSFLFAQICLRAAGGATSSLVRGWGSNNTHYTKICVQAFLFSQEYLVWTTVTIQWSAGGPHRVSPNVGTWSRPRVCDSSGLEMRLEKRRWQHR